MNKLKTDINGKFPFVLDDVRFLDDVYRNAFNAILSGLMRYDGIVYGCKLVVDGNEATVQEGAIWLNGELLPVPEQTFNYDPSHNYFFKLNSYFAPEGNKTFGDGTTHDTYEIRVAEVHDGGSSTYLDDMIKIDASKLVDNAPGRLARLSTAENGLKPKAVVGTSSTGALVSCAVKSAFNKDFATSEDVLDGEVSNKVVSPSTLQAHGDWIDVDYNEGWDGYFKYRKLTNGLYQIKGYFRRDRNNSYYLISNFPLILEVPNKVIVAGSGAYNYIKIDEVYNTVGEPLGYSAVKVVDDSDDGLYYFNQIVDVK